VFSNMKMSLGQSKRLHGLLKQLNLVEEKKSLVYFFTANSSESAADLEPHQAQAMIEHLAACAGVGGYSPPRGLAQPAPAPAPPAAAAPKRRGRPPGTARPAAPKVPPSAEAANRMRRKLFAIGRNIGWLSGDTADDRAMNRAKLNGILERISYLKKPLSSYAPAKLPKLVAQFEQIEKNYAKAAQMRDAGAAVANLLAELGLPTEFTTPTRKPANL
jgi:hypothetical protein